MLIDERDITQKQLAADLKIPASTLGGYVQGTSEPDFSILKELCRYFTVSADYFLDISASVEQTDKEMDLLRLFRTLTDEQKELYLEQGKLLIKLNAKGIRKAAKSTSDNGNKMK